jgi:hypothetical protein
MSGTLILATISLAFITLALVFAAKQRKRVHPVLLALMLVAFLLDAAVCVANL